MNLEGLMGSAIGKKPEMKIVMQGLDAAGKTTILSPPSFAT